MDALELQPLERSNVLRRLASLREVGTLTPADRTMLDALVIKIRCQQPVTLARLEVFELLRLLRVAPVGTDSVTQKLWAMLG